MLRETETESLERVLSEELGKVSFLIREFLLKNKEKVLVLRIDKKTFDYFLIISGTEDAYHTDYMPSLMGLLRKKLPRVDSLLPASIPRKEIHDWKLKLIFGNLAQNLYAYPPLAGLYFLFMRALSLFEITLRSPSSPTHQWPLEFREKCIERIINMVSQWDFLYESYPEIFFAEIISGIVVLRAIYDLAEGEKFPYLKKEEHIRLIKQILDKLMLSKKSFSEILPPDCREEILRMTSELKSLKHIGIAPMSIFRDFLMNRGVVCFYLFGFPRNVTRIDFGFVVSEGQRTPFIIGDWTFYPGLQYSLEELLDIVSKLVGYDVKSRAAINSWTIEIKTKVPRGTKVFCVKSRFVKSFEDFKILPLLAAFNYFISVVFNTAEISGEISEARRKQLEKAINILFRNIWRVKQSGLKSLTKILAKYIKNGQQLELVRRFDLLSPLIIKHFTARPEKVFTTICLALTL